MSQQVGGKREGDSHVGEVRGVITKDEDSLWVWIKPGLGIVCFHCNIVSYEDSKNNSNVILTSNFLYTFVKNDLTLLEAIAHIFQDVL